MPAQKQTEPVTERRGAERFAVKLSARLSSEATTGRDTAELVEADVANLSSGGLFVRGDPVDEPGASVSLSLRVPLSGKAVHLDGQVARVGRDGMGIELREPIDDWQLSQLTAPPPLGRRR